MKQTSYNQARDASGAHSFIRSVCTKMRDNGPQRRVLRKASHRHVKACGGLNLVDSLSYDIILPHEADGLTLC